MKDLLVYITITILFFSLHACKGNSPSNESTASDSITNESGYDADTAKERVEKQKGNKENTKKENATKQNTTKQDTSKKRSTVRIAATEVPGAVITAFNTRYPNVDNVKWVKGDKKGKALYKARWQVNGKKMAAAFAEDGSFIKEKQPK